MKARENPGIFTYSGLRLDFVDPQQEQINIKDIAHGLSALPRFTGQLARPGGLSYNVAQHSLQVSRLIKQLGGSPVDQLWGLLHDASEAYTGDCNAPLKSLLPEFKEIENRLMRVILSKFNLKIDIKPEIVHRADTLALISEIHSFHCFGMRMKYKLSALAYVEFLKPEPMDVSEKYFLDRFYELDLEIFQCQINR